MVSCHGAQFAAGLTYNDENQTFYSSYGSIENGQVVIHGIKIKDLTTGRKYASVETAKGRWYRRSSGAINQVNIEFAILSGGSKPGISAIKYKEKNMKDATEEELDELFEEWKAMECPIVK